MLALTTHTGDTNAYPTEAQLEQIQSQPYTYDLYSFEFRKYWTARTGYSWFGGNSKNRAIDPTCIVHVLLTADENALAAGGNDQCQWYQHIWNIWPERPMPPAPSIDVQEISEDLPMQGDLFGFMDAQSINHSHTGSYAQC